jgi:Rrf2 family protein
MSGRHHQEGAVLFSRACEYGLRAILHLATKPDRKPVLVRHVAAELNISPSFLAKIVQVLGRRGFIRSTRGPGGGVALARSPQQITLLQVIEALDGTGFEETCVLGIPGCTDEAPCPLHDRWGSIRGDIVDMLATRSVAVFATQLKEHGYVLARD